MVLDTSAEIHIEVKGVDLTSLIQEAGGHRLQRVPPTERKGRVHTSTVTVAVIYTDLYVKPSFDLINPKDLKVEWYSGTGCGGQHRNKHQNSCRLTHLPTGLVETAQTRSRGSSLQQATQSLTERLKSDSSAAMREAKSADRKSQTGSGMRGDKIRTYRFQDDTATDMRTGKKANLTKVMAGNFDLLWPDGLLLKAKML